MPTKDETEALMRAANYLPKFDTVEEERHHRKQRLAAAYRLFGKFGFDEGIAGHITARDPERLDHFWVNPFGMNFSHIRVSDLILVNDKGDVVELPGSPSQAPAPTATDGKAAAAAGDYGVNTAAFVIHSQVHSARPDVVAAAHAHSIYGKSWSALGRLLDPITQDVCAFYEDHALFDDYTGVVLDLEEGKRLAHALGEKKAVILRNHGLLTVGHSVDEAAWWFITMERSCQAQLLAEAAGDPVLIDPEMATLTASQVGSHAGGYLSFQPLYEKIVRDQPDLLE
jgi:ribulose-5-phosphate 4-epimerase/fuculose-1-phosphate aldolase